MVSGLRIKEARTIILSVEEHSTPEIANMVNLVCDSGIRAAKEE